MNKNAIFLVGFIVGAMATIVVMYFSSSATALKLLEDMNNRYVFNDIRNYWETYCDRYDEFPPDTDDFEAFIKDSDSSKSDVLLDNKFKLVVEPYSIGKIILHGIKQDSSNRVRAMTDRGVIIKIDPE